MALELELVHKYRDKIAKVSIISFTASDGLLTALVQGSQIYSVTYEDGKWRCTCPNYVFRKEVCKHIVRVWVEAYLRGHDCPLPLGQKIREVV